jgi:hypothetical protein
MAAMSLGAEISERIAHFRKVVVYHARLVIVFVAVAVLPVFFAWRDELLPSKWREKLEVLKMFPLWSLWIWASISAVVVIGLILEGSFRVNRELAVRNRALEDELNSLRGSSPLKILYNPQDPEFVIHESFAVSRGPSVDVYEDVGAVTYAFGVRNNSHNKTVEKVKITIDGDDITRMLSPARGMQQHSLDPQERKLYFLLALQKDTIAQNEIHDPTRALSKRGIFHIRVSGQNTKQIMATFQYDPDGRPHITML